MGCNLKQTLSPQPKTETTANDIQQLSTLVLHSPLMLESVNLLTGVWVQGAVIRGDHS